MHKVIFAETAPPSLTSALPATKIINVFNTKKIALRIMFYLGALATGEKVHVFLESRMIGTVMGSPSVGIWYRFKEYEIDPLDADSDNYFELTDTVDVEAITELRIKCISTSASEVQVFGDCETTEAIL